MTLLTVNLMIHVLLTKWNLVACCLLIWIYCHCQAVNGLTCHDVMSVSS